MSDDETLMDRVPFDTEAAGQAHKHPTKFVYLGATVCENADLIAGIKPERAAG